MTFEQEKDREPRAGDFAVAPQGNTYKYSFGTSQDSAWGRLQQDILLWRHGYETGLREGLAKGHTHPAVQDSVSRMFGDWQGINASLAQSVEEFWRKYRGAA